MRLTRRLAKRNGDFLLAALILFMGSLVASPAVAADNQPDLLTAEERAWLAAHPRIVLGAGEDWAPSVMKDANGRVSGFAVDHLELLNRKLGTDFRIEAGPWHEMARRAEAGEIDGLTLTAPLEERKSRFAFTNPFFTIHDFIFLRTQDAQKSGAPKGLDDLRGMRVGYLKGTLRESRLLAQHPGVTAVPVDTYAMLADKLLVGEIDAAIASYSLEYWRASSGALGIVPTRVVREAEARMVMTIRKDREELVGILNKGLAAITREDVEPLYRRWFGADYIARTATFGAGLSVEERAWLAEHPVLRVGIDPAWAPVEFVDATGVPRGMSLAYLDRLGNLLGLRFEVVRGPSWTEAMNRLVERHVDVLPAIAATPDRRASMRFTEPYLTFPAAIFSAADVAYLGGPSALKGKRAAVVEGEAVVNWLQKEWPDIDLVLVRDTREGLHKIARGEVLAFVGNLVTTSYYIGQSGLTQIKVAGETPFTYRLAMAVRSDWPILAGILQKGIDAIPANERDAIYRDWISIRYDQRVDYSLLWYVLAGAGLLLLLVLGERTLALKRANARLQRLARENALVEERERRRLATELHDSPMQKLALAQLKLGTAQRDVGEAGAAPMGIGIELLHEAQAELRSLQFELSPPMLHQEGLLPALRWLSARATERSGVKFGFRGHATGEPVPQALAVVLFQCARELVYNVAKHAHAHSALITLDVDNQEVVLTVRDDGNGMPARDDTPRAAKDGGFGLFSIRERLALFGGTFSITSDAPGTRAVVRVPLQDRPEHDTEPDAARIGDARATPGAATP
jgi:signal transduction histidine kinase